MVVADKLQYNKQLTNMGFFFYKRFYYFRANGQDVVC